MADIAKSLLDAVKAYLTPLMASGQSLEDLYTLVVAYVGVEIPPEQGAPLPLLLVSLDPISATVISIPPCMTQKVYPLKMQLFVENSGDTERSEMLELLDKIEDAMYMQTFGAEWVDPVEKNYDAVVIANYSGNWNAAGHLLYNYTHTDVRALP